MRSHEVAEAVGAEGETREQRRARLRKVIETPSARDIALRETMAMDAEDAANAQAALNVEAGKRIVGIRRGYGSLADQLEQDVHRVVVAADAFATEWRRMVERYVQLGVLRGEYDALVDGFALAEAPLPPVAILATRKELAAAQETVARVGVPDTNRVFNIAELTGTTGYELLQRAGKLPVAERTRIEDLARAAKTPS